MPTATEVDNLAVAVHRGGANDGSGGGGGKWPRHKFGISQLFSAAAAAAASSGASGRRRRAGGRGEVVVDAEEHLRRNCGAVNCVHQIGNICTDILLQPELHLDLFSSKGVSSSNPLLELCLDGGQQRLAHKSGDDPNKELPLILTTCANLDSFVLMPSCCDDRDDDDSDDYGSLLLSQLERLCQEGCDINVQGSKGYTALHLLINGCSKENFPVTLRAVTLLLSRGSDAKVEDFRGNTSLLSISHLLDKRLYRESFLLAEALMDEGGRMAVEDVNRANHAGRTLLSQSVCHGDASVGLTRLLLNRGAKVLPVQASDYRNGDLARERNQSAFTWFLRSIVRSQSLDGTSETVKLLCQAMNQELESASKMKVHVISTMLYLGKFTHRTIGPLFVQLKRSMSEYWRQPQPLRYLCLKTIRQSIGPKNLSRGTEQLKLPKPLTSYLQLN